jgi:hypothetical protein
LSRDVHAGTRTSPEIAGKARSLAGAGRKPSAARGRRSTRGIRGRTPNALIRSVRCLGELGFPLSTQRRKTLQHATASPGRIGIIARASLVLVLFEYKMIT